MTIRDADQAQTRPESGPLDEGPIKPDGAASSRVVAFALCADWVVGSGVAVVIVQRTHRRQVFDVYPLGLLG